jgi:hypothetical protein
MELEVFFPVIVAKLFARPDRAKGINENAPIAEFDLAIRRAGVIDEASDIRRNVSVDHAHVTRPEEELSSVVLHLSGCGEAPL